jgi:hypothetical protein
VKADSTFSDSALQPALQTLADPARLGEAIRRLTPEQRVAVLRALGAGAVQ